MLVSRARKGRRVNARERHGVLENTVATPALLLHPGLATLRATFLMRTLLQCRRCSLLGLEVAEGNARMNTTFDAGSCQDFFLVLLSASFAVVFLA